MFGLSNFIITEFLLIFYSLVTNVLYSYKIQHHVKKSLFAILKRHNKKTLFFYKAIDRSRVQKLGRFPAQ